MNTADTHWSARKTAAAILALIVMIASMTCLFTDSASAAGGLELSTAYPGISAIAGSDLTFALTLSNFGETPVSAKLSVASIPDGWSGNFTAAGNPVSMVYVGSQSGSNAASATFALSIPQNTASGIYKVRLLADAGSGISSLLDLELNVTEEDMGESSFSVQYPEQEGSAKTSFTFNATLINNYSTEQSYSLSAQAPSGWNVTFTPDDGSGQVASIAVPPRQSQGIKISVSPQSSAEAGEYKINCSAISASENLGNELGVTINESYSIELTTPTGNLAFNAVVTVESTVVLNVTNKSNIAMTNINLTSAPPADWKVRFEPSTIDSLEPGATREVIAYVTPSSGAMSGDYITSLTAGNTNATTTAQFRVTVKANTVWGIVAVAIILLIVLSLFWVFRKYGRR